MTVKVRTSSSSDDQWARSAHWTQNTRSAGVDAVQCQTVIRVPYMVLLITVSVLVLYAEKSTTSRRGRDRQGNHDVDVSHIFWRLIGKMTKLVGT